MSGDRNARDLLRDAIAARAAAIDARAAAAGALRKADAVVARAKSDLFRATEESAAAERDRGAEVADAIRAGADDAALTITPRLADAKRAQSDAESRAAVGAAAQRQLVAELKSADADLSRAKAAVDRAALAVIVDEIGTDVAPVVVPSFERLCEAFDLLTALTMLRGDTMSAPIRAALDASARLGSFIDLGRPQRAGDQPRPVDEALSKLNNYLVALAGDPDAKLDAIASTAPAPDRSPAPSNLIAVARESAIARVVNG